ncbi:MAG: L-histidine N(alpha)-methyltransferase [Pseudomonadota bacterium]
MNEPAPETLPADDAGRTELLQAALAGLRTRPRGLSPKFFYDERGSRLFDAICEQPEYYPTRTEMTILETIREEVAELAGRDTLLVEMGAGAARKVRLLLEALEPAGYLGADISWAFLRECTERLAADYPWLDVRAACVDYSRDFDLPLDPGGPRPLAFFPGSSIGNFHPEEARAVLARLAAALGTGAGLLIGVDLKKDPAILNAAYNDAAGVTAAFNHNLLLRLRDELGAGLDPDGFAHRAFYNPDAGRVEMHLASQGPQRIELGGELFEFEDGETIHTECSYKYTVEEFRDLGRSAGFAPRRVWTDPDELFSVHYLTT